MGTICKLAGQKPKTLGYEKRNTASWLTYYAWKTI